MITITLLLMVAAAVAGDTIEYRFNSKPVTWSDAQKECVKWGGYLATISSPAENDLVVKELKKMHVASGWIGFNDLQKEGSFKWVGAARGEFVNFWHGEPNGHRGENCVEIIPGGKYGRSDWKGKWNDKQCGYKNAFVCQRIKKTLPLEYRLDTRAMTWSDSEKECQKWGGHLATISSPSENTFVVNELKKRHLASGWIGFNDLKKEGSFEWVGAARGEFVNFWHGEPNGHRGENCVEVIPGGKYGRSDWKGKWNDKKCGYKNAFVCQRPKGQRTTVNIEYRLDARQMTWSDSEKECQKWGGHLATISSPSENNLLVSELKKSHLASGWIGFNDIKKEGAFKWVGAARGEFVNFWHGEPNGHRGENCVEVIPGGKYGRSDWKGKWNDKSCGYKNAFVCERLKGSNEILVQLGQVYRFKSKNYPARMMRQRNYQIWIDPSNVNAALYEKDSSFRIVSGLAGKGISFQSVNYPDRYLRHRGWYCYIDKYDGSALFKKDASFMPVSGLAGSQHSVSFESVNYPGYYIRHANYRVQLRKNDHSALFKNDATWLPIVATTVTKCNKVADVGFILDSSGSIAASYEVEKKFVKSLASAFGISKDGPRASVVTFSLVARLSIKFKDHFNINSFNGAVDAIPLMGRTTRIDLALEVAINEMFKVQNGARAKTPKVLILLTDGSQTQSRGAKNPADIAKKLRQSGIHLIVVGIGSGIDRGELARIAGSPDKVFSAASFDELISKKFTEKLMDKSCREVAV